MKPCQEPKIKKMCTSLFLVALVFAGCLTLNVKQVEAGWTSGKFGTAINFDGTNDYVKSNSNLPGASAFSHSLWFKSTDGTFSANEYLFTQGTNDPSVYIGTDGKINVMADNGLKITSTKTFLDTNWHHLEITADGTNLKLYLDGNLESSASYTGSSATGILYVASNATPGSYFGGIIDDVRVYNYARTADEIRLDYQAGYATHFGPSGMTCAQDPAGCMDYGLVGYWGMDEGSGQTTYDLTTNNNDGTLGTGSNPDTSDPKWTKGKISGGLKFDGTDDYVDCGNATSLAITGTMTIETWVKFAAASQTNKYIVSKIENSSNRWHIYLASDGKLSFAINIGGAGLAAVYGSVPSVDTWYHAAAVRESDNNIYIYINGTRYGPTSAYSGNPNASVLINSYQAAGNYFNGVTDEVRIYNRALSAEEVRYHYNKGAPVGHWKFDEGVGSTAYDESPNNNDGLLGGGTAAYKPTWVEGKFGSALSFDGTDDYVGATVTQTKTTYSLWVQNSGVWEHVVKVDSTYYVNGAQGTPTTFPIYVSGNTVQIGKSGASTYVNCLIDDVRIYNYARTPDEIRLDYNAGLAAHLGPTGKTCSEDPAGCMDYGLVGYWGMDEGSGTKAYDASGNGNNGTLTNSPKWTKGKISGGLSFDGTNDYVDCGGNASLNITDAITITAWVNPNGIDEWGYILAKGSPYGGGGYGLFWYGGSNKIALASGGLDLLSSAVFIDSTTWVHVAVTKNSSDSVVFYRNGIAAGTGTLDIVSVTSNLNIGSRVGGYIPANLFNGLIDEVRIYNRALSAEEVRYHYNKGAPVGHWKFDEGVGSTAYDESPNNNDGLLGGGTAAYKPTWVEGKSGSALSFDGVNDYVDCGAGESLNITGAITVEAWVKTTLATAASMGVVSRGDTTTSYILFIGYGNAKFGISGYNIITGASNVADGNWHHVVGTRDASSQKIYVDGMQDATPISPGTFTGNSLLCYIGARNNQAGGGNVPDKFFNGTIDEVRIYNYARTADQILQDYNAGLSTHFK